MSTLLVSLGYENENLKYTFECMYAKWCNAPVVDQNDILHVLVYTSKNHLATDILMPFLSFSDRLLQGGYFIFPKKCVGDSAQNMLNFSSRCSSSLRELSPQ